MKKILILSLIYMVSCNEKVHYENPPDPHFTKVWKTPDNQLTKIELPANIVLDTIEGDHKVINFSIKNVGNQDLKSLYIKPPCSYIKMPKYDSIMPKGTEQNISINLSIKQLGNFYEPITVYGTFYPYKRIFFVEGYRKK